MQFGLGTANFNNNYGLLSNKIEINEIKNIIKNINHKIKYIDTAPAYKNAEKILGKFLKKKLKINTKINPFKYFSMDKNISIFKKEFENSLKNLNRDNIYSLMFHDANDLKHKKIEKFIIVLEDLRAQKIIKKYGVSVYDLKQLNTICNNFNFNIFQLPINLFNINDSFSKKILYLKNLYNFEVHARSIFLQGLATKNNVNLGTKFNKLLNKKKLLIKEANLNNLSVPHIILNKIEDMKFVDVAILGINSQEDYKQLISYRYTKIKKNNTKYYIKDSKITDPRKW